MRRFIDVANIFGQQFHGLDAMAAVGPALASLGQPTGRAAPARPARSQRDAPMPDAAGIYAARKAARAARTPGGEVPAPPPRQR